MSADTVFNLQFVAAPHPLSGFQNLNKAFVAKGTADCSSAAVPAGCAVSMLEARRGNSASGAVGSSRVPSTGVVWTHRSGKAGGRGGGGEDPSWG